MPFIFCKYNWFDTITVSFVFFSSEFNSIYLFKAAIYRLSLELGKARCSILCGQSSFQQLNFLQEHDKIEKFKKASKLIEEANGRESATNSIRWQHLSWLKASAFFSL
jgi:hypothetical protein